VTARDPGTDADPPFPELRKRFLADPLAFVGRVPGVFPVDKPSGPTSHDMVDRLRRKLGIRRVGHGGTLDPLASGVLLLLAGTATRLFDDLLAFPKTYRATLRLGARTDTHDADGVALPFAPSRAPPVAPEAWEAALAPFRGEIEQTPPMHSALKKNGRPLYELARRGMEVPREPRRMTVYALTLEETAGDEARLLMTVSSGFYVRALVDDLGLRLGTGAVMTALVREAVGPFTRERTLEW
jgi:tRNA pseudouridine55 synthase